MKILKKSINLKAREAELKLVAEEDEDMYRLYNLISIDDLVRASTVRNVVTERKSGAREKSRVQMRVTIRVEKVEFDAEQCSLRLNGVNMEENEHIKMGQYHTLELELTREFSLTKYNWNSVHSEVLDEGCDQTKTADVAALVMHDGLAHLCLIKSTLTKTCARIERTLPKKKQADNSYDKAVSKFYEEIYTAIDRHIDFNTVKVFLIGSPGFLNEDFVKFLEERAVRDGNSALLKNRSKFIKAHTSSGHKRAIDEMLCSPGILSQLGDVKAANEAKALQTFHDTLNADSDRAVYGLRDVQYACSQRAIAELLITDKMYRSSDFVARNKFVALTEEVKASGGKVFVFSSLHVTGEQLDMYTGIAATLRFPLSQDLLDEAAGVGMEGAPSTKASGAAMSAGEGGDDNGAGVCVFYEDCPDGDEGEELKLQHDHMEDFFSAF